MIMNKISLVITLAALTSSLVSALYAIQQKKTTEEKVHMAKADIIRQLKPVSEQDTFPHPSKSDLLKANKKTCIGVAHQIDNNTYSNNDFGNATREYAVMILNGLAENMRDGETLSEYFDRKI